MKVLLRFVRLPFLLECATQSVVRGSPSWFEGQHASPAGNGLGILFPLHLQVGQVFPKGPVLRPHLDGLLQPGQGIAEFPLLLQDQPQPGMRLGRIGVEPDRFQVRGFGIEGSAQRLQGVAQIVVHGRQVRLQANGFPAVRQGFLRAAGIDQHLTEVAAGLRMVGRQLNGAAKVRQGFVETAHLTQTNAEVVMREREVRPQFQCQAELVDGFGVPAQPLQSQAVIAVGVGMVRRQSQCCAAAAQARSN